MTTPVAGTTTPTPAANPAAAAKTSADALSQLSGNFQTFLSLLTTQLKNQDPLSPLDSNQFTQQLVQMSGVEAQLNTNNLLQQVATNTSNGVSTAVGLIGKNVKAVSSTANLTGGQAQWTYNLPSGAADVKLEVVDSTGKVVHAEAPSDMSAGDHNLAWNGKDLNGAKLPDGPYSLRVTATDASGAALNATTYVQGLVTAVEQSSGKTLITVGGSQVGWDSVVSITQPGATTPTSTAQGGP
ncbi:flagellar hook assembly protein FlgD [Phenylobacterium sp.]|uniref:flagellar hook assembly protein FlgD n=1 Tax=Phenylobacterium sp. TaxID=1871053 RepID=UPI002DE9D129|nr:flagellar hook assembly protein FlgD [Phenylobacterium sp.]